MIPTPTKPIGGPPPLHSLPQAFINKRGEAILLTLLDNHLRQRLIDMYLAFHPRASFQGLPPTADSDCVKWVQGMIASGGYNLVAVSFEQGVVGHVALFPVDAEVCEMLAAVSPAFQNLGIGTELTRCAIQLAHEIGCKSIRLSVEAPNARARHVYRRCGFHDLERDNDEIEMALDLKRHHNLAGVHVGDIMNRDVMTIAEEDACRRALALLLENRFGSLPVVDADNRLTGIISTTDLMVPSHIDRKVREVFTRGVFTVSEDCTVARVIRMLRSKKIRGIPVVDDDQHVVGIVARGDLLTYYARHL